MKASFELTVEGGEVGYGESGGMRVAGTSAFAKWSFVAGAKLFFLPAVN